MNREVRAKNGMLKFDATGGLDASYDQLVDLLAAAAWRHLDGIVAPSTNE